MKTCWLWWSSGKDSAWTLHELRRSGALEVTALVVTMNDEFDRVAMHAVRRELVDRQARAAGLPVRFVPIPHPCPNERYEAAFARVLAEAEREGVTAMAFGDLFLEDVRRYREKLFSDSSSRTVPIFPLWGRDTAELARSMLRGGLRAIVTCVDPQRLDRRFAGRTWDESFLAELPGGVDPCGENGEFHTFVHAGPVFDTGSGIDLNVRVEGIVEREGFVFADVVPARSGSPSKE